MSMHAITGPNFIVPTPPSGDSSHRIADTEFVQSSVGSAIIGGVIASTGLTSVLTATTITIFAALPNTTASLVADVNMTTIGNYFDGPTVAQGSAGIWYVSGNVTVTTTSGSTVCGAKLWDGSTVIDSGRTSVTVAGFPSMIALSGPISSPVGNLRISVNTLLATTARMSFNESGNSKDCTITAVRIG